MRNICNRKQRGFTLIELLVVIAIIGILAAVVLVSLNTARAKSRDARRLADIRQVMTALELYYNDRGGYPAQATAASVEGLGLGSDAAWAATPTAPVYLQKLNAAPTPPDGACTDAVSSNQYTYLSASVTTYALTFCLGGPTGGFAAGVHTASPGGLN